ncbi:MAG: TonB-dependent receptor, partial [Burkholderiales bacterium]|nr:TonB-dependent receptor [Burkholderiales bacterium]
MRNPGASAQITAGSNHRLAAEFESGGQADGANWFVTGNRFHERGWRNASPSDAAQLFAKLGRSAGDTDLTLTATFADNDLTGNGTQEQGALRRDYRSIYTAPDQTRNRAAMLNLAASQQVNDSLTLTANAWYRAIATRTLNGDVNDEALAASLYQAAIGESAANTPFPSSRCIADALSNDATNASCDGLVHRTRTRQQNHGFALQASLETALDGLPHRLLVGAAFDASRVRFAQSAQFGYIDADRSIAPVTGPGAFADG